MAAYEDSDHTLARRIRRGEIAAFESLFRRFHAPLCEVVDTYVRSQDTAEEIVQDLFLALWTDRARWRLIVSPRAYLFRSARNRALQYLRHRAVAHQWSELARHEPDIAMVGHADPSPHDAVESSQTMHAVRAAIDALPPRTRLAFVLQHDHGMTNAQIAVAMDVSLKGVEKFLATARGKLRELLREEAPNHRPR